MERKKFSMWGGVDNSVEGVWKNMKIRTPSEIFESSCNLVIITVTTIPEKEKKMWKCRFARQNIESLFITDYVGKKN